MIGFINTSIFDEDILRLVHFALDPTISLISVQYIVDAKPRTPCKWHINIVTLHVRERHDEQRSMLFWALTGGRYSPFI